ncbi:hypothetical protein NMG60_11003337 [Bertholletia excelsa]
MAKPREVSPFRLASLLRLQKDPNLALKLFRNPNPSSRPDSKPFKYSLRCYDLIITKLGRAKMFDEMEQIVEQLKNETRFGPKEVILCNIISFYGRARLPDRALCTFEQIPSFRCQRTMKSFNSLINAMLSCRDFEKMSEIYSGVHQYGDPDVCTYNISINACCLCNDLDSAWKLFDEMRMNNIQPNYVTFGTLISLFSANSMVDEALWLKEEMRTTFRVKPNAFVYASLIKGLCKVNKPSLAFVLKGEMLKLKIELDAPVYSALISALFKAARKEDVIDILEEMRENGCKPDAVTYNTIIHGFCQDNDFNAALSVLSEMEKKGCKPDVISYNVIIGALCREGKLREANELFEDMPRRKCSPDVVTYRMLFTGFCDGMQSEEAAFILDEMVFKGYAPQAGSIIKFVDKLCKSGNLRLLWTVINSLAKGNLIDVGTWRMLVPTVCKDTKLLNVSEHVETLIMT